MPHVIFLLKAKAVSLLRFQSKEACILSDCVSTVQSYGIIWQRLKCRSDCFISIQIFFQLDRDQKVVSCVSENGEENKYQGGSSFLLPTPTPPPLFALMPQPKSFAGWDDDLTSWPLLQLSCMWEDIRWLRQSVPISMSSSTVLQTRQKMLAATAQLQVRAPAWALESVSKLQVPSQQAYLKRRRGRGARPFSDPWPQEGFLDKLSIVCLLMVDFGFGILNEEWGDRNSPFDILSANSGLLRGCIFIACRTRGVWPDHWRTGAVL